jgi:hypothetical protein
VDFPGSLRLIEPSDPNHPTRTVQEERKITMSFVSPDPGIEVGGIVASAPAAGPAVAGVHTGDVLAFTGAGPGTFYLAIIGFVTLAAGAVMTLFGRRKPSVVQAPVNGLADLAPLADELEAHAQ